MCLLASYEKKYEEVNKVNAVFFLMISRYLLIGKGYIFIDSLLGETAEQWKI